ncbi:phosphate ABC transporter permease subunit PstC [Pyrococcus abyssi]|uniref:Phosphate transport system permease protein n=1 Tax=Pyrococcus abyssi (strain GE5 / Orsay) TaxID=272844 RepID=Q9UZU9_PYRAB|nr:phosphate ABC transporter permease subunit PstC [Pyrococcus abyssi]CAB49957.1 pstC phosphate ABC transporter, permease protein [Pyrococcus abyssi GE5]CCE70456.1 TPA: phosphate ABC transporter, permease protein [Pyrococcus abyssi GE5]
MKDRFKILLSPGVVIVFGLFLLMLLTYIYNSIPIFHHEGLAIYTENVWNASETAERERYGVLAAIWGSIYTSLIAVLISLPLSISYAIFIVDYAPRKVKEALIVLSDVMAGLPTVIYGIWGITFLVPFVRKFIMQPLHDYLSFVPLFSYPPVTGFSYLSAGILLGIMVTPFAAALIREAYQMVPFTYKEAIYSLGATKLEAARVLIGYIKPAIISSLILAFGRAIGETAAVSLVVGNTFSLSISLFSPGYTISSLIANQFGNAFLYEFMTPALFAAGLALLVIGLTVNMAGMYMLRRWERNVKV